MAQRPCVILRKNGTIQNIGNSPALNVWSVVPSSLYLFKRYDLILPGDSFNFVGDAYNLIDDKERIHDAKNIWRLCESSYKVIIHYSDISGNKYYSSLFVNREAGIIELIKTAAEDIRTIDQEPIIIFPSSRVEAGGQPDPGGPRKK